MKIIKGRKENWEKEAEKVCHDFDMFCEYLLKKKVKLSKGSGNIGKKACFELNSFFTVKEDFEKPTRLQKDYPVINFFYFFAVSKGILEQDPTGNYMQPGCNYGYYKEAEVLERFLLLLMDVLFDGRFSNDSAWSGLSMEYLMEWAEQKRPCANKSYALPENISVRLCMTGRDNLMTYLEELGVLTLRLKEGQKYLLPIERQWKMEIKPLFELVCNLYSAVHKEYDEEKEDLAFFCFDTYWKKHISGGKASGLIKIFEEQPVDYENQIADLEISVHRGNCIRVVRMNLSDSLYKLHLMIQKVFEFENDHLFAFYTGHGMMKETFTMPEAFMSNADYSVHDTALGDLRLHKGDSFSYLFDFGDEWWFDIEVVEVTDGSVPEPELIKAVHDAPEQYPMYEYEEYEDEAYEDDDE